MGQENKNYKDFFNNDGKYRWVIRHATGKELASNGKFDVKQPIQGVTEVYRYYAQYPEEWTRPTEEEGMPEITNNKNEASNAPNDAGTYLLGDVLRDSQGNRWFCILGSPINPYYPMVTDKTAWFVSFDFNGIDTSGPIVEGLPTEQELPDVAFNLLSFYAILGNYNKDAYKFNPGETNVSASAITSHVLKYAGVDLSKICLPVDSTWVFKSRGNTYNSNSHPIILNLAYNDGNTQKQAVSRLVLDRTQAGKDRNFCYSVTGKKYDNWRFLAYQHYEHYDAAQMRDLNEDEAGFGMTKWNLLWPVTNEKMYLQDVASQDMVSRHAKDDKWVTLPQRTIGVSMSTTRRQPRTQAEASAKPSDYIGKYGANSTPKTNIFNEPVIFMRVMKVTDNGGKTPNLVSQDGRILYVEHLRNDATEYRGYEYCQWIVPVSVDAKESFFIDNQLHPVTGIQGL